MSQEIQVANTYPAADYWTQGQAAVGGAAMGSSPRQSPLRRIHRVLRGRYALALLGAVAGATIGAVAGYALLQPKFESEGMISVNVIVSNPTATDSIMPMSGLFIASQTALIESTRVAEEALKQPGFVAAYEKAYPGASRMSVPDFIASVNAERQKNGNIIRVTFADKHKEVAQAGARATITSYMKLYGNGDNANRNEKILRNSRERDKVDADLAFKQRTLEQQSQKYGPDPSVMQQSAQTLFNDYQNQLQQAQRNYEAAMEAQKNKPAVDTNNRESLYKQLAAVDPTMRAMLTRRSDAQYAVETALTRWGSRHRLYAQAWRDWQHSKQTVDDYARDYLDAHPGGIPLAFNDGAGVNLTALKRQLDGLHKLYEEQQAKVLDIGLQKAAIETARQEITRLQAERDRLTKWINDLTAEQELARNINVIETGGEAINTGDKKRYIAAGGGLFFGGLLPVGLLLMYGLSDARFRYSDEASESDMAGVTLLGILPNLPDRLSDPQQAGIAAHCVHQIRTMLQISRTNDEPQVIAVTSAAPGDGKTSLTLALGLSYAACGARTLLIDCDLGGAGLSHRLNVNSAEGVLEAVANRALLEFVRTTDIADVAILPVGTTHAHHASTLSPVALRRLLNESKKHFDVILVDTGPILGSIEASLVAAAADRTILTVARNGQRPLVERSIGHLQAIGSRLAGVVFNRAQARDFERSLSGLALKSRPANGNGATPGATANASAVAGSFKRAG